MKARMFVTALALSVSVVATAASSAGAATLNGGGATFSQPIWQQLGATLKSKVTLNYAGVGSGAGVTQFANGTIDFAGSDPPLTDSQIGLVQKSGGPVVHVPIAFGAITLSYNLNGVKGGLKLDGPAIANIYLGKIKTWDNEALKKLNPKVNLPGTNIRVCRRSESSGTTAGFTTYLSQVSPEWVRVAGAPGNTAKWPVGSGAQGNAGVAACVKQSEGGIGYVEQAFAIKNRFTYAAVKNKKKQFIYPKLGATSLGASGLKVQKSLRFTSINSPVKGAYPIVSQTFMVNHRNICGQKGVDASKAAAIVGLINYIYSKQGTSLLHKLFYAEVPSDLKKKVAVQVRTFTCNGKKIKAQKF